MEEMQKDCWAAPVRPELAALVFPYTSEQSLPSDPILFLLGHGTRRGLTRRRRQHLAARPGRRRYRTEALRDARKVGFL